MIDIGCLVSRCGPFIESILILPLYQRLLSMQVLHKKSKRKKFNRCDIVLTKLGYTNMVVLIDGEHRVLERLKEELGAYI